MANKKIIKIKKNIETHLSFLKKNYQVKKIGIFGSLAKGKQKKNSDIDLMVEFISPISFFQFLRLEKFLSKILKRKVDLVSKKAIKPVIKNEILKEITYL